MRRSFLPPQTQSVFRQGQRIFGIVFLFIHTLAIVAKLFSFLNIGTTLLNLLSPKTRALYRFTLIKTSEQKEV